MEAGNQSSKGDTVDPSVVGEPDSLIPGIFLVTWLDIYALIISLKQLLDIFMIKRSFKDYHA